jgi:hypothetical protein
MEPCPYFTLLFIKMLIFVFNNIFFTDFVF